MIFWTGWLSVCLDDSNKWISRCFRIRDNKLEYMEIGDEGDQASGVTREIHLSEPVEDLVSGKDIAVAKEVQQVPEGMVSLDDVCGFCVCGNIKSGNPSLVRLAGLTSRKHQLYHQKECKLVFIFKNRESWRIRVDDPQCDISSFLLCVERCLPRATVSYAGWMHAPGTISVNRRYLLAFSTGHLMIFKDSSLDHLRRELYLGDPSSAMQTVQRLPTNAAEERTLVDSLLRSYASNGRGYHEAVALRVMHASVSDKKGYPMSVERNSDQETAVMHFSRFKELVRILQTYLQYPSIPENGVAEQIERLQHLRRSYESRMALKEMEEQRIIMPHPSLRELARAGFPATWRSRIWAGLCKSYNLYPVDAFKSTVMCAAPRSSSFNFPLVTVDPVKELPWIPKVFANNVMFESKSGTVIAHRLVTVFPNVFLSAELITLINFFVSIMPEVEICWDYFSKIFQEIFLSYHANGSSWGNLVKYDMITEVKTFNVDVDVAVVMEIVQSQNPAIRAEFLVESFDIVRSWLLSGFTYQVPFSRRFAARLWDVISTSMHLQSVNDLFLRYAIAIFASLECKLSVSGDLDTFRAILIHGDPSICINDMVVHLATKDRTILRVAGWQSLKEQRLKLWGPIEIEARHRIATIERWQQEVSYIERIGHAVCSVINKCASLHEMISYFLPVHECTIAMLSCVTAFQEALQVSKFALEKAATKSTCTLPVFAQSVASIQDEVQGCTNISVCSGGQIAIHPTVVIQVIRSSISLSWALCGFLKQVEFNDDRDAFKFLSMLSECKANGGVIEKGDRGSYSLRLISQNCASFEEMRESVQQVLINGIREELRDYLLSMLSHLDELSRCVVDTSVSQQQRTTDMGNIRKIFIPDVFGGEVDTLSRLVPFMMSSAENIRVLL